MRQLHVLGVSDDGTALLLGAPDATKPTHRVVLDDRLRAAVRGQLPPPGADRVESALSPKEIQARLRAGDSPETVAKAAGIPLARVVPYAAPVLAERERIVDQARAAVMHRSRGPAGDKPLGELVDARLAETPGLREESVAWTARRRGDGAWEVELGYRARGGSRSATWLWRPAERDLTPLDLSASRLGADAATKDGVRRKPAAERPKPAAPRPAAAKPARAARKAATGRAATAAPTRVAKPARPAKAGRPAKAARGQAAPVKTSTTATPPRPAATGDDQQAAARRAGGRVPLPSWSDVLLGVQATPRETAAARRAPATDRRRKG